MKKSMMIMTVLAMLLALSVPFASALAQDQKPRDAAAVYADWYNANGAKDYVKALGFANEYLEKFPNGDANHNQAAYLKGWKKQIRGYFFNEAIKAKNMDEAIKWGKEALAEDPEEINYLYILAYNLRANEIFATPPNMNHAADTTDFTQRTIKLVEAGKLPNGLTADKKNSLVATLHQTLAVIAAKSGNTDKALEEYKKSTATDPTNNSLNAYSYLACGSINQAKYNEAKKKFDALPAEKQTNAEDPDYKAAFEPLNLYADAALECWAHFLALPDSAQYGKTRDEVEKVAMQFWKFRHEDKIDGWAEYVAKFKTTV
jgi:tetratricopeptide (TPR) repeat protein